MAPRVRLPAKLTRPSTGGLLNRERLFARLDALRSARCVWIVAQAGSGKTSLVSSWIGARSHPHAWYQVDAGDADPAAVFHYLGLAASTLGRDSIELPHLTPEYLPGFEIFVRRFFEHFFARLKPGFVLVFDDYQELPPDSPFHAIIATAIHALPKGTQLLCVSRQPPPAALARWRAEDCLQIFEADHLRLTDAEAETLAHLTGSRDSADAASLNLLVHGWAAGLKLLLQTNTEHAGVTGNFLGKPQLLFDYLATEVFERMYPATRELLIKTSFLPSFSAEIATQLSGIGNAENILLDLHRSRLFIDRHVQGGIVTYEYHPLFRAFLMDRARAELPASEISTLQGRAATLLEADGDINAAANLLTAIGDWTALKHIILRCAPMLMAQGRIATLEGWLSALPSAFADEEPWLAYWLATCQSFRDMQLGRIGLERSYNRFRAAGDESGAFLTVGTIIRSYFMVWGDTAAVDHWIAEFETLLAASNGSLPVAVEAAVFGCCEGIMFRRPDHPMLPALVERAMRLAPTFADQDQRFAAGAFCLNYLMWRGEFIRARRFGDDLVEGVRFPPWTWSGISFDIWRAIVLWQMAEHDASEALLHNILNRTERSGMVLAAVHIHMQFALSALSRGDLATAEQALQRGWPGPEPWQAMSVQAYRLFRAVALSLSGRTDEGAATAQQAHASMIEQGSPISSANSDIVCGYVLVLANQHENARRHLESALVFARSMPSFVFQFLALMPLAWSKFETGEEAAGMDCLREALAIGRNQTFMNCHPVWVPRIMSDLLGRALEYGIEPEYARRLIRVRKLAPPTNRLDLDAWPWPLRIYTLGRFAILLDDKPLQLPSRAPKKPLELLKALIAFGSRGVAISALTSHLWQDQDDEAARNALNVALHRLRKFLRDDEAIVLYEGKLSLDPQRVWVDAWSFQRLAGTVDDLVRSVDASNSPDMRSVSVRLLRVYLGHFLVDEEAPWALGYRERLRSKFLRAAKRLTTALEGADRIDDAIELQRRAIELDSLEEEFHRGLMRNLQMLGRIAEGMDAYRRCREILSITLSVEPSAETQAIYRSLKETVGP